MKTTFASKAEFINYLQKTLIPDLRASGSAATAKDFCEAVAWLQRDTKALERYLQWHVYASDYEIGDSVLDRVKALHANYDARIAELVALVKRKDAAIIRLSMGESAAGAA